MTILRITQTGPDRIHATDGKGWSYSGICSPEVIEDLQGRSEAFFEVEQSEAGGFEVGPEVPAPIPWPPS